MRMVTPPSAVFDLAFRSLYNWLYPVTVPKFDINLSEAVATVLISCDIKSWSLTWHGWDICSLAGVADMGYDEYLIVPFWYASAAYQAGLVWPWVFWLDLVSPNYKPWLDQTAWSDVPPKRTKKVRLSIKISGWDLSSFKNLRFKAKRVCSATLNWPRVSHRETDIS